MRVMMAADRVIGGIPAVWPRMGATIVANVLEGRCAAIQPDGPGG